MDHRVKVSFSRADAEWLIKFLETFYSVFPDDRISTVHYNIQLGLKGGKPGLVTKLLQ